MDYKSQPPHPAGLLMTKATTRATIAMLGLAKLPLELREMIYFWIFRNAEPGPRVPAPAGFVPTVAPSRTVPAHFERAPVAIKITHSRYGNVEFQDPATFLNFATTLVLDDMREYLKNTALSLHADTFPWLDISNDPAAANCAVFRKVSIESFPRFPSTLEELLDNMPLLSEVAFNITLFALGTTSNDRGADPQKHIQNMVKRPDVESVLSFLHQKESVKVLKLTSSQIDGPLFTSAGDNSRKLMRNFKWQVRVLEESFVRHMELRRDGGQLEISVHPRLRLSSVERRDLHTG